MYRTKEQVGWDNRNTANFAGGKKEGLEEGLEKGREEGREEGALTEKKEIAKKLKIKGLDFKMISEATSLTIEEIVLL